MGGSADVTFLCGTQPLHRGSGGIYLRRSHYGRTSRTISRLKKQFKEIEKEKSWMRSDSCANFIPKMFTQEQVGWWGSQISGCLT